MRTAAVLAAALAALVPAGVLHAASPPLPVLQRPNPVLTPFQLDYETPLEAADGGVASLAPLSPAVIKAAVDDQHYLAYRIRDDLGGFQPAPIGRFALQSGGHIVVGVPGRRAEIPLFQQAAGGRVNSFTFTGAVPGGGPSDNGQNPVPGLGPPVQPPTPTGPQGPPTPPGNQGFGGNPGGSGSGGGGTTTTTTTPKPPPPTTTPKPPPPTTPTTTTATTTTATTATTSTATTTAPGPTTTVTAGSAGDCGTAGISITSNLSGCRIDATNMKPGDSTAELVTVTNTTNVPYDLSLGVTGSTNALWQKLTLAVWRYGDPAPAPGTRQTVLAWKNYGFTPIRTLSPGQAVTFEIELYLPTSAGNDVQDLTATIDFVWHASG